MGYRWLMLAVAALPAFAQTKAPAKAWTAPRTADGKVSLEGVWSTASSVPLERPKNLGAKEFYTPEEFEALQQRPRQAPQAEPGGVGDVHYDLSQFGLDRSHATISKNLRTSLITGPTGRVPDLLPAAQKRQADRLAANRGHLFDGPENRGLSERCILWGTEGPPMLPVGYNSNLQIVQGVGYVAILQEMIHDVRMIPTDGRAHLPKNMRLWFGDSRGHWEGDTLVVDTTNFTDRTALRGSSENLHVVERFNRTADGLLYRFTVDDPSTWETSWSAEVPFTKIDSPIYEYACQEANYGLPNILSGARFSESEAAKKK